VRGEPLWQRFIDVVERILDRHSPVNVALKSPTTCSINAWAFS